MGPVDFVTFRILTRFPLLPSPPFTHLRKEVWNVYFSNVQLMGMISFTSCSVPFYVLPRLFLTPLTTLRIDRQSIFHGVAWNFFKTLKVMPLIFHIEPVKSIWIVQCLKTLPYLLDIKRVVSSLFYMFHTSFPLK